MTSDTKRTVILLSVLAVVAVLVVFDRKGAQSDDASEPGSGDQYLAEAGLLGETRAVADAQDEWNEAAGLARDAWGERRSRMIAAPSAEIAAARLRTMIEQLLQDEGLEMTTTETLPSVAVSGSDRVAVIGLSLSFDARDAAPVYRVLDRVENMPGAASRIESVALRGPGRMGGGGILAATLRVRAVANLTGESRG